MTENRQEGNLKLRLRTTDTSRFKTEQPNASAEKPAFAGVSPNATVPTSQINDPVSQLNNSTGRLKKVTVNDETQATAMSPLAGAGVGPKKNETVKLKVVKANAPAAPGPAAQAPLRLDDVNSAAPAQKTSSTSTGSLKLPKLGGLRLANATTSVPAPTPGATTTAPPPVADAPTSAGSSKPAVSTATAALKLPMRATLKRPTATAAVPAPAAAAPSAPAAAPAPAAAAPSAPAAAPAPAAAAPAPAAAAPSAPAAAAAAPSPAAAPAAISEPVSGATQVTTPPAPAAAPAANIRNTTTLKIRPVGGAKSTGTTTGSASATLKITPPGQAKPAAAAPAQVASPSGEPALKQTGVKLSLKKSDGDSAAKTVTAPPPAPAAPAAAQGNAAATVAMPPPPAAGKAGLKLKKDDAAATVAMPAPSAAGATAPAAPPTEGGKGKIVMTKAPKSATEKTEGDVMPEIVQNNAADDAGKLPGICAIISFLALGAACYFIVMDFLKFVK